MKECVCQGKCEDIIAKIREIVSGFSGSRGNLIPVLQKTQEALGYLPPEAIEEIARLTGLAVSEVYGVATFYAQFKLTPRGKYVIRVCHGTACHVGGATQVGEAICDELGVRPGETTKDGKFTVENVACLGCCSLAPVIMIEDEAFGRLTPSRAREVVSSYVPAKEKMNG